ncbi:helix-turn-helix domain-containing protein [Apilactobacillus timberlakei]|uniref:helix-turn-helix domain-containing protein n=1 Tax=Apilactobacillus timberlakei TaxID=2008380 RepID=UPI00112E1D67|nr:helix-turn-helix transcriptional regulator [Apilactobacillus timberlakei]TPR12255.1 XRE family transcriptional regulator [Apilactobacillus timberlakei]
MRYKHLRVDLKRRRKDLGYTQVELAKKLNISVATLQNWEQRKVSIGSIHLKMYARALKMDPLDIIDPDHEFNHYEDTKEYHLENSPSIHQIVSRCIRLSLDRVKEIFEYTNKKLAEQIGNKVTYEGLLERSTRHMLRIYAEAYSDDNVVLVTDPEKNKEEFNGNIPEDYFECLKIKTDDVSGYSNGQKVFLRRATNDMMYSGINVVAKYKDKFYLRNFRSTNSHFYLIPINSKSATKDDSELNGKESKYIWNFNDGWEIPYVINQSAF